MDAGIYSINSYVDIDAGLDVAYSSKDYGARVIVMGLNEGVGTNNQFFQITANGSGWKIRGCDSSNVLDSTGVNLIFPGTTSIQYQEIMMMNDKGSTHQTWYVENVSGQTVSVNGEAIQVVRLKNGSGKYLCCPWGNISSASQLNYAVVKDSDATDITQWWVLRKNTYRRDEVSVPADAGLFDKSTNTLATSIVSRGVVPLLPTWICDDGLTFQVRWRWRGRIARSTAYTGWSKWRSISDGASTDDGYGNVWSQNVVDKGSGRKWAPTLYATCEKDKYDLRQYQVEVRQAYSGYVTRNGAKFWGWHGGSVSFTANAYYKPILTISNCYMTPHGLVVRYASDFKRGNNTLRIGPIYIGGNPVTNKWYEYNKMPYTGQVCIPPDKLAFVPAKGATWSMTSMLKTCDSITTSYGAQTGKVDYSTGFSNAIAPPTTTEVSGGEIYVTFGESDADHSVTLVYEEGKKNKGIICEKTASGSFRVLPPSGKKFSIIWKSLSNDKTWASGVISHKAITLNNYIWSVKNAYVQAFLFENSAAPAPHSVTRDYESALTQGRRFESVFFGNGSKGKISIDCVVPAKADANNKNASIEDMRLLLASDYAVFRTPDGQRHDVAITGMDDQITSKGYYKVSIDMVEVDPE